MFDKYLIIVDIIGGGTIVFPGNNDPNSDKIKKLISGSEDIDDDFVNEMLEIKQVKKVSATKAGEIKISKTDIFGCYSIQVLSEIIARETGIPPYRQSLLHERRVITHDILYHNEIKYDYLYDTDGTNSLLDLPIDTELVKNREDYAVYGKERSTLVMDFVETSYMRISVLDLSDVFAPRKLSEYEHENVFFGFIRKFWPMSEAIFVTYCENTDIQNIYPDLFEYESKDYQSKSKYFSNEGAALDKPISEVVKYMEVTVYSDVKFNSKVMFNLIRTDKHLPIIRTSIKSRNKTILISKVYQFSEFNYLYSTYKKDLMIKHNEIILVYIIPDSVGDSESNNIFTISFTNRYYSIKVYDVPSEKNVLKKVSKLNLFIDEINDYDYLLFENEKRYARSSTKNTIITDMSVIINIAIGTKYNASSFMQKLMSCGFFSSFVTEPTRITCKFEVMYNPDIMAYIQKLSGQVTVGIARYYDFLSDINIANLFSVYYPTSYEVIFFLETNLVIHLNRVNPIIKDILVRVILNIILEIESDVETSGLDIGKGTALRYLDPDLFVLSRFSEVYRYARICQKPFQPIAISEIEWGKLNKKEQENYTKYWNFTHNIPMYYKCPSSKAPYLGFIVDKHPKGYCLPCCQKKVHKENSKKYNIFNKCLQEYIYISEKEKSGEFKRYILNYDRDKFELGRMFSLPQLLNDNLIRFNINFSSKKEKVVIGNDVIFLDNLVTATAQIKFKTMNVNDLIGELNKIISGKTITYKQLLDNPKLSNKTWEAIKTSEKPIFLDSDGTVIYGIETICRSILENHKNIQYKKVHKKFIRQAKKMENNINYYILIVQQNMGLLPIGSLYSLAIVLSLKPEDLLDQIIGALSTDVYGMWSGLLDVFGYEYQNIKSIITDFLYDIDHQLHSQLSIDWNKMVFYCCRHMFKITIIIIEYDNGNYAINLENYDSKLSNTCILLNDGGFYPVVFTSSKNFLNNMVKVIYSKSDIIHNYITDIIDIAKKAKSNILIDIFKESVKEIFMINRTTIFMIKLLIDKISSDPFYIPTEYSEIVSSEEIPNIIGYPKRNLIKYSYKIFADFIAFYNGVVESYIKTKGLIVGAKGVSLIKVTKLIVYSDNIIGIKSTDFYYYFDPISTDKINEVSSFFSINPEEDIIFLLYDPDEMNDLMINNVIIPLNQKEYKMALYRKNIGTLASMNLLDELKINNQLDSLLHETSMEKIESIIRKMCNEIFEIEKPDFDEQYKIVKCKVNKSIFCKNNKLVIDPTILKDIIKGFIKDITNPTKIKILENNHVIYSIFTKLELQKMADELIFIKID